MPPFFAAPRASIALSMLGERRDVARQAEGSVADLRRRGFRLVGMPRDDRDLGARLREHPRDALADAFRSAGDDDGPSLERLGHGSMLQ